MRLFLVRHGQTEWNARGLAQGHTDLSLDATGLAQTEQLIKAFASQRIANVWSSDLKRCIETAQPLAKAIGAEFFPTSELKERHLGEWEALPFTELWHRLATKATQERIDDFAVRPPGGESALDVWNRLASIEQKITEANGDGVVVTHGGAYALLLARLINATVASSRSFRIDNTGVSELIRRPDGYFALVRFNDTSHLSRPGLAMVDANHPTR